jgi:hypothetical protein
MQLDKSNIKVAEYLTVLQPKELLPEKLHKAIEIAKNKLPHPSPYIVVCWRNFMNSLRMGVVQNNKALERTIYVHGYYLTLAFCETSL